ncbi:unnamed protein product, partial [Vitis vinifera]
MKFNTNRDLMAKFKIPRNFQLGFCGSHSGNSACATLVPSFMIPGTKFVRMECNKDEAIRAKGISERKMTEKDMAGARKFAMKAQNLYPGLDGLPQLLATIDVYRTTNPKPARPPPSSSKPNTFWTLCSLCRMQYEYLRTYLNHTLLCPNCHEPFLAFETPPPPAYTHGSYTPWTAYQQKQSSNQQTGSYSKSDSVRTTASASSCAQSTHGFQPTYEKLEREHKEAKTTAMKEPTLPRKTTVSKKSGGLATGASNIGSSSVFKGESPVKRRRINEFSPNDSRSQGTNQMRMENGGAGIGNLPGFQNCNSEMGRINASRSTRLDIRREPSQLEIRNMLMEKARRELVKKLSEWTTVSGRKSNASKSSESADTINRIRPKTLSATLPTDADENETEPMTMSVPDPDIHDFDKDRTELSFGENQVWAAYDDDDGMPRYYAMIHSVISLKPFKLRISWLNAKSNTELAPLNWVVSGFSKTSGEIQIYPRKGDVWALYRNWSPDWDELTPDEVIHKYEMVEVIKDYNEDQGILRKKRRQWLLKKGMKKWRKHNQNDNEVMSQYHIQTKQFFVKILSMPSSLSAVPPTSDQSVSCLFLQFLNSLLNLRLLNTVLKVSFLRLHGEE